MSLVTYSSSDDSDVQGSSLAPQFKRRRISPKRNSQSNNNVNKNSDLPPLPPSFHDLYATAARASISDDPSLHGGRKRTVPHVAGNWPTHVYLEWYPTSTEVAVLNDVLASTAAMRDDQPSEENKIHSLVANELEIPLPLHISLSASLSLGTEQKDRFAEMFTKVTGRLQGLGTFEVTLADLLWAPNYDRNRWFFVAGIQPPEHDELNLLLRYCNDVCESMDLPTLYMTSKSSSVRKAAGAAPLRTTKKNTTKADDFSDKFHLSIGWTLNHPSKEQMENVGTSTEALGKIKDIRVKFDSVKVKIGNTITSLPLRKDVKHDKGILG